MAYSRKDHYTCGHTFIAHNPDLRIEICFCGGTYDGSLVTETLDNEIQIVEEDPRVAEQLVTGQPSAYSLFNDQEPIFFPSGTPTNYRIGEATSGQMSASEWRAITTPTTPQPTPTNTVPETSANVPVVEWRNHNRESCPICQASVEQERRRSQNPTTVEEESDVEYGRDGETHQ